MYLPILKVLSKKKKKNAKDLSNSAYAMFFSVFFFCFFFFLIFFIKAYVVGIHFNCIINAIQMSTTSHAFIKKKTKIHCL